MDLADRQTLSSVKKRSLSPRQAATLTTELQRVLRESELASGELQERTGVDPAVVWRFLAGERTITLETADRICAGLGMKVRLSRAKKAAK